MIRSAAIDIGERAVFCDPNLTASSGAIRNACGVAVLPDSGLISAASHFASDSLRLRTLNPMYSMVDPSVPPLRIALPHQEKHAGKLRSFSRAELR